MNKNSSFKVDARDSSTVLEYHFLFLSLTLWLMMQTCYINWVETGRSFAANEHKTQIILSFFQTREFRYTPSEDIYGLPRNAPP